MTEAKLTRAAANCALALAVLIWCAMWIAVAGHWLGFWPQPDFQTRQGLPSWPNCAVTLTIVGLAGHALANRHG